MLNKCATCSKEYKPQRPSSRFCSKLCVGLSRRGPETICHVCATTFRRPASASGAYCSTKCANHAQDKKETFQCKMCKGCFRWSPSRKTQANITYCSNECRWRDPDDKQRLIELNQRQQLGKINKLEAKGYAILDAIGVEYFPQHLIGEKFCVDAFVPETGLVIQFDGDYWHGHPEKYPIPSTRQAKRIKLDMSQDAYMKKCGFDVVRFWECEVISKPDHVEAVIRDRVNHRR